MFSKHTSLDFCTIVLTHDSQIYFQFKSTSTPAMLIKSKYELIHAAHFKIIL